jgi:hypothetical protein
MDFVEGKTGSCNETRVKCDVDGTEEVGIKVEEALDIMEEVSIKVEEAIDINDENPQAVMFPPVLTEQEVRLWCVCVSWWQLMLVSYLLLQKEIVKLHLTVCCSVLCFGFHIPLKFGLQF